LSKLIPKHKFPASDRYGYDFNTHEMRKNGYKDITNCRFLREYTNPKSRNKKLYCLWDDGTVGTYAYYDGVPYLRMLHPIIHNNHVYVKMNSKLVSVSRLVAEYFIPNIYNCKYVIHIDGDILNNDVNNLMWSDTKRHVKSENYVKKSS